MTAADIARCQRLAALSEDEFKAELVQIGTSTKKPRGLAEETLTLREATLAHRSAVVAFANDEHRARRVVQHVVAHRSQHHPLEEPRPVRSDDDKVERALLGDPDISIAGSPCTTRRSAGRPMAVIVRSMPASICAVTDLSIWATVSGRATTLSMSPTAVPGAGSDGGTTPRTVASKSASMPAARCAASMASWIRRSRREHVSGIGFLKALFLEREGTPGPAGCQARTSSVSIGDFSGPLIGPLAAGESTGG